MADSKKKSEDQEIIENLDFLMSYEVLEDEANWETVEALDDDAAVTSSGESKDD